MLVNSPTFHNSPDMQICANNNMIKEETKLYVLDKYITYFKDVYRM